MIIDNLVPFGPFLTKADQLEHAIYLDIYSHDGEHIGFVDVPNRGAAVEWNWTPPDLAAFKEALESVGCSTKAWEKDADGEMQEFN